MVKLIKIIKRIYIVLRRLRKTIKCKEFGVHISVNRRKKIVYCWSFLEKEKVELKNTNLKLMSKIAHSFNINPFEYGIQCNDCKEKLKTENLLKEKIVSKKHLRIKKNVSILDILSCIEKNDDVLFIFSVLFYMENIIDDYRKVQRIEKKYAQMDITYNHFHVINKRCEDILQNSSIKQYMAKCFSEYIYIDEVFGKDLKKQIFSINNFVKQIYQNLA